MTKFYSITLASLLLWVATPNSSQGRGFGGSHGGGGGFRGGAMAGGGFGGGGGRMGGFGGEEFGGGGGFAGRGGEFGGGEFGRAGGFGGLDGGAGSAGLGGGEFGGRGAFGGAGFGGSGFAGAGASRSQLNSFLGLPTDGGMHAAGGGFGAGRFAGGENAGAFGRGEAAGRMNQGPEGNVYARGGVTGRGFAAGPAGSVAGRGAIADRGYGSATYRHAQALSAHRWYDNNRIFSPAWSVDHPWAWHPDRYSADVWARRAWRYATWPAVGVWLGWGDVPYINYDYGDTIVYEGNNVYQNGQVIASAPEYYEQASELAGEGSESETGNQADADWLPLGVYGLMRPDQKTPEMMFQLAVDKQGDIRGNYYTADSKQMESVHGAIDKATQRAAWTVGQNNVVVVETGLYNLTQDQSTALVHLNSQKAETYTLIRMKQPPSDSQSSN